MRTTLQKNIASPVQLKFIKKSSFKRDKLQIISRKDSGQFTSICARIRPLVSPARQVARKKKKKKKEKKTRWVSRFHARPGIQREIGASVLRLAESGRREGGIARGGGEGNEERGSCMNEFGERLLSPLKEPRVHSSYTCYHPVSRLAPHREIFSRANDLVLHSLVFFILPPSPAPFFYAAYTCSPFSFFCRHSAKNASSASQTTFNRGPNCVARKSARTRRESSAVSRSAFSFVTWKQRKEKRERSTRVNLWLFARRTDALWKYIARSIAEWHFVKLRIYIIYYVNFWIKYCLTCKCMYKYRKVLILNTKHLKAANVKSNMCAKWRENFPNLRHWPEESPI